MEGLLVLNGGNEFRAGNEPQDELLVEAAGSGPAFVVPTAAARQRPEQAVATATGWFARLGLEVRELPVLRRRDAQEGRLVLEAERGTFFYLTGGDPGLVVEVLAGTPVWAAIEAAWRSGAALAGSSAGAMALAQWTLVMARWPRHEERKLKPALGLVPGVAVVPHYERFARWKVDEPPADLVLLGIDEATAAVWDGLRWTARGAGAVTLAGRRFSGGDEVPRLPHPGLERDQAR